LAAPIGDCENGPLVSGQAMQDVMAVLPNRFGDYERRRGRNILEDRHAIFLRIDETVLFRGIKRMAALDSKAKTVDRFGDGGFHSGLRRPTHPVGGKTKIATCDQNHGLRHGSYFYKLAHTSSVGGDGRGMCDVV